MRSLRQRAVAVLTLVLAAAAPTHASDGIEESIHPGYTVSLRPGGLVALDPEADRFGLSIGPRMAGSPTPPLHLRATLSCGSRVLSVATATAEALPEGRASLVVSPFVPWRQVAGCGRLRRLIPRWEHDGFTFEAEVRAGGPAGPVVYALRDPDRTVGISWTGFFSRIAGPLTAVGVGLGLLATGWRRRRVQGPARREILLFDLVALGFAALTPLAFSPFAAPLVPLLGLAVAGIPPDVKQGLVAALRDPGAGGLAAWSPALGALALTATGLAWHYALIRAYALAPADFRPHLPLIAGVYLLLGLGGAVLLHRGVARRVGTGRGIAPVAVAVTLAVAFLGALRRLDWATFFHTGAHADGELWRHAFYGQGLTLAATGPGPWLAASLVIEVLVALALVFLARRWAEQRAALPPEASGPVVALGSLATNVAVAAALGIVLNAVAVRAAPPRPREISDSVREAFTTLPEVALVRPLWRAAVSDDRRPERPAPALVARLEQAGVTLGALRTDYPLLKPSIHLAPPPAERHKPSVPAGTNLIVILVESLSSALLDEGVHAVPGLTPHLDDFAEHALSMSHLWAAEFPTIRGEVAALASFAFGEDARGTVIGGRSPLDARFLFLAEVMKALGYTTVHAQSDFGTFAGTARMFRRHGYDDVWSADEPEIRSRARRPLDKTWGVYDEDLFASVVDTLDRGALRRPFLLTIATTDMHFPYATTVRHPANRGDELLDSVHSTDAAFGRFWQYFKSSPYADNTLVLVTADHALVRRVLRYSEGGDRLSRFDWLAGLLYVPGNPRWQGATTGVLCSQLDLAPTLLDILDVDAENPFLGLSIFSGRPSNPLLLGREGPPLEDLPAPLRDRLAPTDWSDEERADLLDYLSALARSDAIMPPGPVRVWRREKG